MHFSTLKEQFTCFPTIATTAIVLLLTVIYFYRKYRETLPGPFGVPYLGLLPFLERETGHLRLTEYGKKYGDVYSFTYCGRLFIHLGSIKATREFHINKSEFFGDRFSTFNIFTYMIPDGVVMANGEMWKVHKKFFIQKFREYGLNSLHENVAGPIYDSLEETVKILKDTVDKPINIMELLTEQCTVTLRKIVFGENGISDEDIHEINRGYTAALAGMTGTNVLVMGPFGRLLFNLSPTAQKCLKEHDGVRDILNRVIKRIESSMDEKYPTCIIEEYYKERNERRRQNDPIWKFYTDKALVSSISQFVGDGVSGVAGVLLCFLHGLIQYPDEQEKIYEEIMEVVGPSRQPTLADKAKLSYTNAFMTEYLRISTLIPLFPSVECTKETTYQGYKIPKGAITVYNFWAIHRNPHTFENPDMFNPSRYLPTPGKPKAELPLSFGMGKRSCSGESFAMAECFLFFTTIVKNFKIVSSNETKNASADFILGGNLELRFEARAEM